MAQLTLENRPPLKLGTSTVHFASKLRTFDPRKILDEIERLSPTIRDWQAPMDLTVKKVLIEASQLAVATDHFTCLAALQEKLFGRRDESES